MLNIHRSFRARVAVVSDDDEPIVEWLSKAGRTGTAHRILSGRFSTPTAPTVPQLDVPARLPESEPWVAKVVELSNELKHLRDQVTSLQSNGTKLLEENRWLKERNKFLNDENDNLKTGLLGEPGNTTDQYQDLAARTINPKLTESDKVLEAVMGISGEAGEMLEMVKKHRFQGHHLDYAKLMSEAGDLAWYLAALSTACSRRLASVFDANIKKLVARYPDGFNTAASINRTENQ